MMAEPTELPDWVIEDKREPLEQTLDFIHSIEAVCVKNVAALPSLGGNIFIRINGVGEWTLITSGNAAGFYAEPLDEESVDFALVLEEWVLHELLDGQQPDLEDYFNAGVFYMEGDFQVFQRLLRLAQGGGGMVGIRASRD